MNTNDNEYTYAFKIILLGDPDVGKSSFASIEDCGQKIKTSMPNWINTPIKSNLFMKLKFTFCQSPTVQKVVHLGS